MGRMERERSRKRTPEERLSTLAEFVNWMMDALGEKSRTPPARLSPDLLVILLTRHHLRLLGTYTFGTRNNPLDGAHFAALCREVLGEPDAFLAESLAVLPRILSAIFDEINGRVASLYERLENREAGETMLGGFDVRTKS